MIESTVTNARPTDWAKELHRMGRDRPEQNFANLTNDELLDWVQQLVLVGSVAEMRARFAALTTTHLIVCGEQQRIFTELGVDNVEQALETIKALQTTAAAAAA